MTSQRRVYDDQEDQNKSKKSKESGKSKAYTHAHVRLACTAGMLACGLINMKHAVCVESVA